MIGGREQLRCWSAELGTQSATACSFYALRSALCAGKRRPPRRGAIFIIALGTIVILVSMLLAFSGEMRTAAMASANRLSLVQADAVEHGAEMWVLAQVEANPGDAVTITQTPAEALQVGNGWFWILHPDPTTDQQYGFGITDESAKLNINYASSLQMQNLPGVTQDATDSMYDWRTGQNAPASTSGAKNSYYESLQEPYDAKNGPYESIEELMLVKNMTQQILYGYDLNHDGVIDAGEQNAGGMASVVNSGTTDTRGIFNYITCYTLAPSASAATTTTGGATIVNIDSANTTNLENALSNTLGQNRAQEIITSLNARVPPPRRTTLRLGDFFTDSQMTASEFGQMFPLLRTSTTVKPNGGAGMININTAPAQVLACLPNLATADGQTLANARGSAGSNTTDISWFFGALGQNAKVSAVADYITTTSYFYSADIVAVAGNGRSFKRVRIVVDARATPAKIIYRKDLTALGWPLPPEVRQIMRSGQPPPDATFASIPGSTGSNAGGAMQ
jgi:type II secretory pathway component PulK